MKNSVEPEKPRKVKSKCSTIKIYKVDTLSYKTISANKATVTKEWIVVDAENMVLGRLASKFSKMLRVKYKADYTPHVDCGDNVIVINAEKIRVTGNKESDKIYYRHSRYAGGLHSITLEKQREKFPTRIIEAAVKGMMPKGPLGRAMLKKLKVYAGEDHPHAAQQPEAMKLIQSQTT